MSGEWKTPKASDGGHSGPNGRDSNGSLHLTGQVIACTKATAKDWPTTMDSVGSRNKTCVRPEGSRHHAGTTLTDAVNEFRLGDVTE